MFRLYKLYTLYMNKMTSYGAERSPYWCLCQKLPRSILHIEPTPEMRCDVCGRLRRPSLSSSSDEEEIAAERSQKTLAQQLCSELYKERQKLEEQQQQLDAQQSSTGAVPVRVNVSQNAQKPKSKRRAANCNICGNKIKSLTHPKSFPTGRFGHCRKPYRLVTCKHKCPELEPTAPSPPRSQSTTPPPQATASLAQSPEDCNDEDIPNLVAFAHEVFNRPLHLRQRQTSFYDNLFVSDFIPLDTPITDGSGGAISKRRRLFGRPLRTHCSRPLPPLSQVLALIKEKQQVRAKGGGLAPKQPDESVSNACSQFAPFDQYDGPSEDALVVEEARQTLRQPHALHIKHRPDLPSTRLPSFESEPGSDCSSLSACDAHAAAAPADRKHTVGAPAHLHEMMKAVTQSGLSDSIASSSNSTTSSTTSSSHKSASSTLPLRSRGGEEIAFTEDEHELEEIEATTVEPSSVYPNMPISIMEKIFWLVDQKQQQLPIMENKSLLQFIQELSVPDDEAQTALIHEVEQQLAAGEAQTNDMSNELPLNSTNKTADHEKYDKVLSHDSSAFTSSVTQMWSTISSLFVPSGCVEEMLPLKSDKPLGDGSSEKRKCKSNTNDHNDNSSNETVEVRYKNPAMAVLSAWASVTFWLIYWSAFTIIYLAGTAVIFGLTFPKQAWKLLNFMLNQYHIERQFTDEL
ncbi:CG13131 [Drosophila busckii]|uniref:CG13131 n=1 Tax=Drosophila busckii TaxID=30019 RepID=A0A0M4EA06_DROBS|nr:CG13131 [Drosophila busckii]